MLSVIQLWEPLEAKMKLGLSLQIDTPRLGSLPPASPTGFAAVPGIYEVAELSWDLNPATSTNIYVDSVLYDSVLAGTSTYSFTGTPPGNIYDFQISAVSTSSGLESSLTAVISCAIGLGASPTYYYYLRPDAVSYFRRPDTTSRYIRP